MASRLNSHTLATSLRDRFDRKARLQGPLWEVPASHPAVAEPEEGILGLAEVKPNDRVLDVGTGRRARHASRVAQIGADIYATDLSFWTLSLAAVATREAGIRVPVVQCDNALPFRSHAFDVVICSEVLEYWHDDGVLELMHEILRVLKAEGRAVVDAPDAGDRAAREIKEQEERDGVAFFLRSRLSMHRLFTRSGFSVSASHKREIEVQYLLVPTRRADA